ncbi:hypothetical protein PMSD_05040 [Paenibacillus macquariensis subsp. defensor]|nr:hypothetical protein PMSD_05040 [Paenibacillus macquariensis subsp. defensor]
MKPSYLISTILLTLITSACSNSVASTTEVSKPVKYSTATPSQDESNEVIPPKLGGRLEDFEGKYDKYDSHYRDSYTFESDNVFDVSINTDHEMVNEVSVTGYSGDYFLPIERALKEINEFLPSDSVKIASKEDNGVLYIAYESKMIAEKFENMYSETEVINKGRILIRANEGKEGSGVRSEAATNVRMTVGIESSEEKELGLKKE